MKQFIVLFFVSVAVVIGLPTISSAQSELEINSKRAYWPSNVKVTQEFSSDVMTAARVRSHATFRPGQRLSFQRPYKPGEILVKNGTSFVIAPLDSTDFWEQVKKNERLGRRTGVAQAGPVAPGAAPAKGKALLELKVLKGKGQRRDKSDYDNKSQNVVMKVGIKSRELQRSYTDVKARIYVLGEEARTNLSDRHYKIISFKEHTFDLPPGKVTSFETPPATLRFDDNAAAKFGIKFYGYLLEIQEGDEIIASKSSPSTLLKFAGSVREAQSQGSRYGSSSSSSSGSFELK